MGDGPDIHILRPSGLLWFNHSHVPGRLLRGQGIFSATRNGRKLFNIESVILIYLLNHDVIVRFTVFFGVQKTRLGLFETTSPTPLGGQDHGGASAATYGKSSPAKRKFLNWTQTFTRSSKFHMLHLKINHVIDKLMILCDFCRPSLLYTVEPCRIPKSHLVCLSLAERTICSAEEPKINAGSVESMATSIQSSRLREKSIKMRRISFMMYIYIYVYI